MHMSDTPLMFDNSTLTESILLLLPREMLAHETQLLVRRLAHGEREDAARVEAPHVVVQVPGLAQRNQVAATTAHTHASAATYAHRCKQPQRVERG